MTGDKVTGDMAEISIGPYRQQLAARGLQPGPAVLAVRPNRVELGDRGMENSIPARIAKSTYVGSHLEYTVETEFGTLFAISSGVDAPLQPDSEVSLNFAASGPVLLPDAA